MSSNGDRKLPDAPKRGGSALKKDIWVLAKKEAEKKSHHHQEERTLFILGSEQAGKSTIINRFLDRQQEGIKPTVALEYTFARKSHANDMGSDIVHLWELAGGTSMLKLVETPISTTTLRYLSIFIILDLSNPNTLWTTATQCIQAARQRIDKSMRDLKAKESKIPAYLIKKAASKYSDEHQDKQLLDPCPCPMVIVGSKYDVFEKMESVKRKLICGSLRLLAHLNGAHLVFSHSQDKTTSGRLKSLMSHYGFKTTPPDRFTSVDPSRPLFVPAGTDSLQSIGKPQMPEGDMSIASARNLNESWQMAMDSAFPPTSMSVQHDDPSAQPQFDEPMVDAARQKFGISGKRL